MFESAPLRHLSTLAALAVVFLALLSLGREIAHACPQPPPRPVKAAEANPIGPAALARDLVAKARSEKDPALMIAAARVLRRENLALVFAADVPLVLGTVDPTAGPARFDYASALAEARALSRGDPDLLAQIAAFEAQADKGLVPQSLAYSHDLAAGRLLSMPARAEGGRIALVRVRGDGDAALRLTVVDGGGHPACSTQTRRVSVLGEDLVCRWTPERTADYRIQVSNIGSVWTRTILVSN